MIEGWELKGQTQVYSDCNSVRLFWGQNAFGSGTAVSKSFQLPPHHKVVITLELLKIDSWDNEQFLIYLDQILAFQDNYGFEGDFLCGLQLDGEKIVQISNIKQHHNFQSLFIFMTSNIDQDPSNNHGESEILNYIYIQHNAILDAYSIKTIPVQIYQNQAKNWMEDIVYDKLRDEIKQIDQIQS